MKTILLFCLLFSFFLNATDDVALTKVALVKGVAKIRRGKETLEVKQGMVVNNGDIISTERRSLVVINSKASTYKIAPNSELRIDLSDKDVMSADMKVGTVVINFAREKISQTSFGKMKIKTPTASLGVRGTRFFAHVGDKNKNSVLSVESGSVAFEQGGDAEHTLIVEKNSSSMTNVKGEVIEARQLGFEDKINWKVEVEEKDGSLEHDPALMSALEKVWDMYKKENAANWKKRSEDMEDRWNNF